MSKFDQAKMLMKVKKAQKELQNAIVRVEAGDGAVIVEMNGEMKLKKVNIDPEFVDLDDIGQLERWVEEGVKEALSAVQKMAQEKMAPFLGSLGDMGL